MKYPKITIACDNDADLNELRMKFISHGIFTFPRKFNEIHHSLDDIDLLIITTRRYSSPAFAAIIHANRFAPELPIIFVGNELSVFDGETDLTINISLDPSYIDKPKRLIPIVIKLMTDIAGPDPTLSKSPDIICDVGNNERHYIYYKGTRLFLTRNETNLLHYLAAAAPYGFTPSNTIAEYTMISPSAIAVHIAGINKCASLSYGENIIHCKKSNGYYLS